MKSFYQEMKMLGFFSCAGEIISMNMAKIFTIGSIIVKKLNENVTMKEAPI